MSTEPSRPERARPVRLGATEPLRPFYSTLRAVPRHDANGRLCSFSELDVGKP